MCAFVCVRMCVFECVTQNSTSVFEQTSSQTTSPTTSTTHTTTPVRFICCSWCLTIRVSSGGCVSCCDCIPCASSAAFCWMLLCVCVCSTKQYLCFCVLYGTKSFCGWSIPVWFLVFLHAAARGSCGPVLKLSEMRANVHASVFACYRVWCIKTTTTTQTTSPTTSRTTSQVT